LSAPVAAGRWLAFDTSTDELSLAVARGDQVWTQTLPGGAQSSSGLIPAVFAMLSEAEMTLATLDAIVFGRGPGSFTGLRTACAVAQGLAFGAGVPVLPIDTLLAVAEQARWAQHQAGLWAFKVPLTVLALLDARMGEVYSAAYRWQVQPGDEAADVRGQWQTVTPLQVGPPELVQLPEGPGVLLAGNAFAVYPERLPAGQRWVAMPTAAALLRLAPAAWAQGQVVPAEQAMPLYVRDKVAHTTAEREALKIQAQVPALQNPAVSQP
jgi:tRNA threonylcarbamoyladenosine biosynthesis protein TsaB